MSSDLADTFRQAIVDGLKSSTLSRCSRWACHRRKMPPITGEGDIEYFNFKYHPWGLDLHNSKASFNTAMKAAQMGITEVAINQAFYAVDVLRKDVLYVLPTALNASDFAKARFNTALSYSPHLKTLFTDTNTIGLKQAGGVNLYIRGSRGDSNLKSIPVSMLILDEVDEMDQKQIWLALERLSGHIEKTVWAISTPTIPKYGVHKLFLRGTQEHYTFKCPHCNRWTELIWPESIKICGETVTDPRCAESYLICKECEHKLEHEDKPNWLSPKNSKWVATAKGEADHRSWYINQLYSYTVKPKEIAVAHFRGYGDEAAQCEFFNSKIGEPFIPDGGQVVDAEIESALAGHTKSDPRPQIGGQRMITMGIDQGKWNHIVVTEYLFDDYSYDLNVAAIAKVLWEGKIPGDDFRELDKFMREWQVLGCVIDADPQTNDARRFARRFHGYVYLCRYRRGQSGKEITVSEEDDGAPIATVDRTNWLDATLGRYHSGRIWLPRDVSMEFRDNMKNLVRTYERDDNNNPKATYVSTGADHFAHALNYAEIALPLAASIVTGRNIGRFL